MSENTVKEKPHIFVIVGPTGAGKSALAVALAKKIGGEVVSADSRQIYKKLNIGAEKISRREMSRVHHWCLDLASPKKTLSVVDWRTHAEHAIRDIVQRGKVPIVAGGTGLYVEALMFGTTFPSVPPNHPLRATLAKKSSADLFALLKEKDPVRAHNTDPHNPRRLIRALEVAEALGKNPPLPQHTPLYNATIVGIFPPLPILETFLKERLKHALKRGLIAETKKLHAEGMSWKRLAELGLEYRIVAEHLRGQHPKEALPTLLFTAVRHYAKRQITWWKRYKQLQAFTSPQEALAWCIQKAKEI